MQLDLLAWQPPVIVIPFPTARRIGHIRRTAERIHRARTEREASAYWHRAVSDLRRQMERAGVPADQIERELRSFHDAVQGELRRLSIVPRHGGDAA